MTQRLKEQIMQKQDLGELQYCSAGCCKKMQKMQNAKNTKKQDLGRLQYCSAGCFQRSPQRSFPGFHSQP